MFAPTASSRVPLSFATFLLLHIALLAGCENPFNAGDGGKAGTGKPNIPDPGPGDTLNRYEFLQGKILATGRALDLAIEGKGLFILRDDTQFVYLRRPAMFTQDAEGYLRLHDARHRLQGVRLYSVSNPYPRIVADSLPRPGLDDLGDVRWPGDDVAPPKATTVVKLIRNLDSESLGKNSILHTLAFLRHAQDTDLLICLRGSDGISLGIRAGDTLTFSASNGGTVTSVLPVTGKTTLVDLATSLTFFLRKTANAGLATTVDLVTSADSHSLRGAVTLYGNTAAIRDLRITSNRPASDSLLVIALAAPAEIRAGTTRLSVATGTLRSPALAADRLDLAFDAQGIPLGLEAGDTISFSGSLGGRQVPQTAPLRYASGAGGTTLDSLLARIRTTFDLPKPVDPLTLLPSVTVNPEGSEDGLPDGSLVIRGEAGLAIQDVSIRATDANSTDPSPHRFNTNMNIAARQNATAHAISACSLAVYDAAGKARLLSLRFSPIDSGNWWFQGALDGVTTPASEATGKLTFRTDATFSLSTRHLTFSQDEGGDRVFLRFELDATGLTRSRSATTIAMDQDGFTSGALEKVTFGGDGIITGAYANGQSRPLYRLPLADFANPAGLRQLGENFFLESTVSGKAILDSAAGVIRPGSVEYRTDAERDKVCALFPGC